MKTKLSATRAALLAELMQEMQRFGTPATPLTVAPPALANGAGADLAIAAAKSSELIADACARLGEDNGANDATLAAVLWNETLQQIERIQRNMTAAGVPGYDYRYPFQSKTLPVPPVMDI